MLEFKNVSVRFRGTGSLLAVDDVTLSLPKGSRTAIIGETGSGKSVLLLAALRLLPEGAVVSGSVCLDGENLLHVGKKRLQHIRGGVISYIPQGGGASMNPLLKIGFQVGEPLIEHRQKTKKEAMAESVRLLRRFNLHDEERVAHDYPHALSGGMRQRVMIAMGMAAGPSILFADEPTKGLDQRRIELVEESLQQLKNETLLCVTHDMGFAGRISDAICVMYAAQQVELGTSKEILEDPLHPYTQDMLSAMPENGMVYHGKVGALSRAEYIGGGGGCRYRDRCLYCSGKCQEKPPFAEVGNRKVRCWRYVAEN